MGSLLPASHGKTMMIEIYIARHIAKYLLKHYFPNRKTMAQTLGIPYRSLLRVFNEQSYPGDVQRTMNAIAICCMEKRIPPEDLFAGFVSIS